MTRSTTEPCGPFVCLLEDAGDAGVDEGGVGVVAPPVRLHLSGVGWLAGWRDWGCGRATPFFGGVFLAPRWFGLGAGRCLLGAPIVETGWCCVASRELGEVGCEGR